MQSLRNPTRRNRNIGTAKQGHGQNNELVIPEAEGLYWLDRIGEFNLEQREIAGRSVSFIVENTRPGCVHPCSVSDVAHALGALPASDWAGLDTFVFRQPTRKQLVLSPTWGRLRYYAEIKTTKGRSLAKGPALYLDAVDLAKPIKWSTSLDAEDTQELERLKADGHEVQRSNREHAISVTAFSARNTQLYRTLLHEVGHWFDWLSKVEEPAARGGEFDELERSYFARPRAEREAFAHRYADAQRSRLQNDGTFPFESLA
jgi:hypothetical protein